MRQKSQVRGMRSRRSRRLAVDHSFLLSQQPELELHDIPSSPIHVAPLATAAQIISDSSSDRPNAPLNAPKQSQSPCSSFVRTAGSYVPHPSPADATSGCTKKKRGRGPTCMREVWEQLGEERKQVSFNSLGQPNDMKTTSILANFLGTVARNGENAPLHYLNWRKMPESYKEDMMKLVKLKFDIPEIGEEFVIKSLANKWRNWKCTVKKMYFDPAKSVEEHLSKVPERVDKEQWKQLVIYWSSEEGKNISETNKKLRGRQVAHHCMGTRSFAVVKEMEKEKLGRDPSRADMFIACYAKPDGTPVSQVAGEKIEKMKELLSKDIEGTNGGVDMDGTDVYSKVMGKDKPGCLRTYGLGVSFTNVLGGKRRRASYALALEYKSAFENMKRQCGELSKKLEEMQNNSGSVQTPSPNSPNCFLASTSVCRAIQMATSLQEDYWSTEHLELFCKLCIEQIDKKEGSHLNEEVWKKISDKFEELTGKKHDSAEMRNTWDNLKEEWENWKQLMKGEAEMGWDYQKQTVGASEEWWKRKIQTNPAFRNFRAKGIPPDFESLLDRMFMDVATTGYGAWEGSRDSPSNFNNDFAPVDSGSDMNSNYNDIDRDIGEIIAQLNKGKEVEPQEVGTFSPPSDDFAAAAADSNDCMNSKDAVQSNAETKPRKSKKPMPNKIEKLKVKMMMKKKKKKKSRGESKLKKKLDKMYSAVESKSVGVAVASDRPSAVEPTYDEIMEMLDEIPEVEDDDELHFFALDHLKERVNQVIFRRFKTHEKRASWLKHEFKKQQSR